PADAADREPPVETPKPTPPASEKGAAAAPARPEEARGGLFGALSSPPGGAPLAKSPEAPLAWKPAEGPPQLDLRATLTRFFDKGAFGDAPGAVPSASTSAPVAARSGLGLFGSSAAGAGLGLGSGSASGVGGFAPPNTLENLRAFYQQFKPEKINEVERFLTK